MPKTSELVIPKYNLDISIFTRLGSNLASVTPEKKWIPLKNKIKETLDV